MGGPAGDQGCGRQRARRRRDLVVHHSAPPPPPPDEGPGGPILVVAARPTRSPATTRRSSATKASTSSTRSTSPASMPPCSPTTTSSSSARSRSTRPRRRCSTTWVTAGGNLIAMRPDPDLAGLLGLTDTGTDLSDAYLLFDTSCRQAGRGTRRTDHPVPRHRRSVCARTRARTSLATLYSNASTATANPAVTVRSVGSNGGQAAAFTYDLAKSVVYTRQGNPAWAGTERDGEQPPIIRSDDMFYPGLDRLLQDPDPAGRRAAAPAREPHRARQPRQDAAAAVLVLPPRREGRRRHDRRRPRRRRHHRPVRLGQLRQPGRLQRRRLGLRTRHVVHVSRAPPISDSAAGAYEAPGLRD